MSLYEDTTLVTSVINFRLHAKDKQSDPTTEVKFYSDAAFLGEPEPIGPYTFIMVALVLTSFVDAPWAIIAG